MGLKHRFLVVVNPVSGNGRGARMLESLKKAPAGLMVLATKHEAGSPSDWAVIETTPDGSWRVAAETQIRSGRIHSVITIGGDGTIMEVATMLFALKKEMQAVPNLVPLPGGRGNDFIRGLCGYSADEGDYWEWLEKHPQWAAKFMDLASCNGRIFMNMASIGYGGEVVEKAATRRAFWSKTASVYQVEGALAMLNGPGGRCEAKADGQVVYSGEFFGAFVGNGKANGSGLFWTAAAKVDDGMIDAIVFPKPGLISMASSLAAVKKRQSPTFKHSVFKGAELVLHFDRPTAVELDGDFVGRSLSHEFKCIPQALRVWLPGK